jgi:hypothetical protein
MDDFKPELLKALLDWVRLYMHPTIGSSGIADTSRPGQHLRPPPQNHITHPARGRPDTLADPRRH